VFTHRNRAKLFRNSKPKECTTTGPNHVGIRYFTYLRSSVRGKFYYLYLVADVCSPMIVGREVHEEESSELASVLVLETCLRYEVNYDKVILHSYNRGSMKGATMLATLHWLGIITTFSCQFINSTTSITLFSCTSISITSITNFPMGKFTMSS